MTNDPKRPRAEDLHHFDIRRESHGLSREEADRNYRAMDEHPDAPGKLEMVDGKLYFRDAQRITMLGWLLETMGADAAVRLGDPDIWRAAVDCLPRRPANSDNDEAR